MPNPSIKNERVYRALRRRGYSKESAARISNAQKRRAKSVDALVAYVERADHNPALADAYARLLPELPSLKGESLGPGITRIRGNLCNVHGRYGRCPGAQATNPRQERSDQRRQTRQTRAQQRQAARDQALADEATTRADEDAYIAEGGTAKERAARRREVAQARRARAAARREAARQAREREAADRANEDEAERNERLAEEQPKGGGGGKKPKPSGDEKKRQQQEQRAQTARATAASVGLGAGAVEALRTAAEAGGAKNAMLSRLGLIDAAGDATDQGRRALSALERGDVRGYRAAVQDAQARLGREADRTKREQERTANASKREQDRAAREAKRDQERAAREARRDADRAADRADQATRDGRVREDRGGRRQRRIRLRDLMPRRKAASFRVFKDNTGHWRWVAFSSTAYRDRDGEIVSTKALADDVARADATGNYGPLRWWHMPGLDLGDCDFNALSGRVLIESGTFKSERIARIVAAKSADLEISLGFLHPPSDPDTAGVFHTIRRFERSLTPRGKASNLFTQFRVKEPTMALDTVKRAALKALGFGDGDIAALESQAASTEKTADAAGVAYKAADEASAPPEITLNGVTYTLAVKAPPPVEEEPVVEEMAEPPLDEGMAMEEDPEGGLTLSPEDLSAIGQAVGAALEPLLGAMNFEQKMRGMVDELKTSLGGYQAQKDSEAAEQREQLGALAQTVKAQGETLADLTGTQPAAVVARASASQSTIVPDTDPLVATVKAQQEPQYTHPFGDMMGKLFGNGQAPPAN